MKLRITHSTSRKVTLRQQPAERRWCPRCGAEADHFADDAQLSGVDDFHGFTDESGRHLVCAGSLPDDRTETKED